MAIVRFAFNPTLVEVRREVCPSARFEKSNRQWIMTDKDASAFVRAAHSRLEFTKCQARVMVDDTTWVVGFVQGAPFRADPKTVTRTTCSNGAIVYRHEVAHER